VSGGSHKSSVRRQILLCAAIDQARRGR
jgi:hypothetical protein